MTLHHYPSYKPSGVEWLGDVPAHWEVRPGRAAFQEVVERDNPDEQLLSVTIARGVIAQEILLQDSSQKDSSRLDKSDYKLVCPGDIVYNKMRAWQGAVGMSAFRGIVSPAYIVQRPRLGSEPSYFHHLVRLPAFATEAERWSYGIASDMWSLRPEHFKMIQFCLPPLHEQRAIVRYLDYVDRRVRRYVAAKRKLIALLEEERQAVIHQAVTRGLDPNVPLKPSGVEWLGDIPAHWEIRRLRNSILEAVNGVWGADPDGINDLACVRVADFDRHRLRVRTPIPTVRAIGPSERRGRTLLFGNLLLEVSGGGEQQPVGVVILYDHDIPSVCSNFIQKITLRSGYDPQFLTFLHGALYAVRINVRSIKQTTGIQNLDTSSYFSEAVAFPPLQEQHAISEYLLEATLRIETAITRARRQVELLEEYRTRLIADVVTGKLDVRAAAPAD